MKPSTLVLVGVALVAAAVRAFLAPFPPPGGNPYLDLIADHDPGIHRAIRAWYYLAPGVAVLLTGSIMLAVSRVWLQPLARRRNRGRLPAWPDSANDDAPSLVVGELHHPTVPEESERPSWLVIPEKGLYTGVLVVGAVGTGKTTACMYPFARQLLSWQAGDPGRRAGALVLEVKGDFCHKVRRILADAGRADDYLELGLGGSLQWNPLDDPLLDSYSMAYGVASLINQLFGKSREPFWQQAYTNLVRWIIELFRLLPGGWVTLRDIYRCTIDAELFARKIGEAKAQAVRLCPLRAVIAAKDLTAHKEVLGDREWDVAPDPGTVACRLDEDLGALLEKLEIGYRTEPEGSGAGREFAEQVAAVERWYLNDWMALDAKLRTSIVEGISVFLSLFDQPEVAGVFCPPPPADDRPAARQDDPEDEEDQPVVPPMPGLRRRLPPLSELIESGKVLALNMPAGANPALARAIGVLLKNAWMQALLRRPAEAARRPGRYMRPAVFICDEYQAFATVGQDDPSGDEKAFALTRQCRCIPIVATQSISSLRSVLPSGEAWRTLVQTLRTRIFLSLSDEASAKIASEMCGSVMKTRASYTFTETTGRPEFSLLSGRAGGGRGTIGASKSFRQQTEPVFTPRAFALLANYQAICLPYDGVKSLPARRVYLKPHYLPRETGYWRLREEGRI
ncbi:MAG: TraM recognition domain-containing protein [Gemmatimonadota bacterium]|nr:TraM recognition domain-containing protein [Gemmatimonadota bacterium]